MKLIEIDQNTGSFDTFIASHFINNPHLEKQLAILHSKIVRIQKKIDLCFQKNRQRSVCFNPAKYSDDVKNFDIGKEAMKITSNFKDALVLINVLAADPGQYAIQEKIILGIRRSNPSRLSAIKRYFLWGTSNYFSATLRVTKEFFGMNFQRNWSVRNYKVLAGLNIGLGLREKGFIENEVAWFSRIVNEAYKFRTHVLHDFENGNEVMGNKPYFVMDSSAAYAGAVLASRLYNGDKLNNFESEYYKSVKNQGRRLATANWNWGMRVVGVLEKKNSIIELKNIIKNRFQEKFN